MIMDEMNNTSKKRVSCGDNSLAESFQAENISDLEMMGNIIEDLRIEELHGEMNYIFEDGVERSIRESGFDSMNKERSEENIVKGDEKVGGEENFEQNKQDSNQGSAHENNDAMHGHGVKRTNSNIMGRR